MKMLTIKDWDKFQHYKDRNPPWIKLATDLFQNYDFSCLHDASKLLAICIWTLASRTKEGQVAADFDYIKSQCLLGNTVKPEHLKELITKGYLIDASNTLADCKQSAIPETYREETYREEGETERYSSGFENFWMIFPKKRAGAKDKAWRAYLKALERGDAQAIYSGLENYAQSEEVARGFAKGCAAWLNDDRWLNDYSPPKERTKKSSFEENMEAAARAVK